MICKCPAARHDGGTSFKSLMTYMVTGKAEQQKTVEKVLYSGSKNLVAPEIGALKQWSAEKLLYEEWQEMLITSWQSTRCKDPVFHGVISFQEGEVPTKEQCAEAVDIYLKAHGLETHQSFWATHQDTENIHIHVCANRIDSETGRATRRGWYKRNNEIAARQIELAQGWSKTLSGHLAEVIVQVDENGQTHTEVVRKKRESGTERKSLSTSARDFETQTGEKSAERIAQERAANILFKAVTWTELHARLAEQGIEIQQKGSGGILIVRGQPVKLSSVGRGVSMKALTERLGAFQERDLSVVVAPLNSDKIEILDINSSDEEKDLRKQYAKERTEYYIEKRRIWKLLDEWTRIKRDELREKRRNERENLYTSRNWKGHGSELNAQRSLLAFRQAKERDDLNAEISRRRTEFKKRYGSRFLSIVEWQRARGRDDLAEAWRHRNSEVVSEIKNGVPMLFYGQRYALPEPKTLDYDHFSAEVSTNAKLVIYKHKDNGQAAFIDKGHSISVLDSKDETSTLAALKLAAQKWGTVNIHGTKDFIEQVVKLAAENDVKLRDPALQAKVEELREKQRKEALNIGRTGEDKRAGKDDFEAFIRSINAKIASIDADEQAAREKSRDHIDAREAFDAERDRRDLRDLEESQRAAEERKRRTEQYAHGRTKKPKRREHDGGLSW